MNERSREFLRHLLDAPGPSGFEARPAQIWRKEAETFADEVTHDVLGNSFARVKPVGGDDDAPRVLLVGHIDEIGFQIIGIDKEGFLWFDPVGGWDAQVVIGQRIRILARGGDVIGVIGKKASHLLKPEDRSKPTLLDAMWIDIGAADREDAQRRVEVGDPAVIDSRYVQITDDLCTARALDNRVGAFVALEAARLLAENRGAADVYAVAATQEETTFNGALTASFTLPSLVGIAIDVTHPTDYPGADSRETEVKVGGGATLTRGVTLNEGVYRGLRDAARRLGYNPPVQATAGSSGTDADPMIHSGAGTATGVVSIPCRYMHSPNEVISLSDVENAAQIIAEFVRTITPESDFRPGSVEVSQ